MSLFGNLRIYFAAVCARLQLYSAAALLKPLYKVEFAAKQYMYVYTCILMLLFKLL